MHLDVSLNTVVSGLIVAAIIGAFRLGLSTAMVLRELKGAFDVHVRQDEMIHEQVRDLEKQVAARR